MTPRTLLSVSAAAALALTVLPSTADAAAPGSGYHWDERDTGTSEQYRGLAAVNQQTAWVSGEKGGVLRTEDGGHTWTDVSPAAAQKDGLALRDIEAWDARHAVALSIGPGQDSRIFRTDDGGRTWHETFRNTDEAAFFNCIAFTGKRVGLAVSDPVDGKFRILRTTNGGRSWRTLPNDGMPAAGDPEFNFAASGTCLVSAQHQWWHNRGEFWMVSGGAEPRVFHTKNAGTNWSVANAPIRGGEASGIYSAAFKHGRHGVIVGGDYTAPEDGSDAAATSRNGGKTWKASRSAVSGYRSGVAHDPRTLRSVLAVGPNGSDLSRDGGRTWNRFGSTAYDGVQCARDGACWASGPDGAVAVLARS